MDSRTTLSNSQRSPPAAVITNSIIQSPVVQSILHAKVRGRNYNDVVLVGDDCLQVKQVKNEGHMDHIATKSDFDSRIQAAKVFAIDSDDSRTTLVKTEEGSPSDSAATIPLQCIILTLESKDIMFLYLRAFSDCSAEFVFQTFPMPSFDRVVYQPGHHLAVDHQSRAFAVAALEREIVVYAAKPITLIQHELRSGDPDWCPVSAQRPIQIDGIIQQMDFLIPPSDDPDHVALLVIVAQNRKIKAIQIDWQHASDLHHAEIHEALPLDQAPSMPGMLIPLRNAAFMLANGHDIKRFDGILSGSIRCQAIQIAHRDPSAPGESLRRPMWTNWCRPERGAGAEDQLYLAREDGNIFHVHEHNTAVSSSNAGNMDCHIGTAFASVGGLDDPDILVAAGDMSSGCVKEIGPRFAPGGLPVMSRSDTMEMKFIESLPNWASVTDIVATTLPGKSQRARDGVSVTSGRQPFGAVTELRYGLEVKLSVILPLEDLSSVQNVWAVPVLGVGHVLLILSGPGGTTFLRLESEDAEVEVMESTASLDTEHETIAANLIDNKLIQITNKSISATTGVDAGFEDRARFEKEGDASILAATCLTRYGMIVTAERTPTKGTAHALLSYQDGAGEESGQTSVTLQHTSSYELPSEVLAMASVCPQDLSVVVVTTSDGDLEAVSVDTRGNFTSIGKTQLLQSEGSTSLCDSIVIFTSSGATHEGQQPRYLILCGLRDGRLLTIQATFDAKCANFGKTSTLDFGQSTVKLTQPVNDPSIAYAMSGFETCKLTCIGTNDLILDVKNIWLSDKNQPALAQGSISSCGSTPPAHLLASTSHGLADSLVFVSGDEILIGRVENDAKAIPRQIEVSGTPSRLLYLEQQRCFACASLRYEVRTFSSAPFERRQIWPVIDFLPSKTNAMSFSHEMQPGDRVYALLEWSFKREDDKVYSFLLVGGSYVSLRSRSTRGRITFLQPTNRSWEVVDVKEGRQMKFDHPVYAMALLDPLTFVACYGCHVVVCRFSKSDTKWQFMCAPFEMHSPGTNIVVDGLRDGEEGSLLTIATMKDSATVLRLEENELQDNNYEHRLVLHRTAPRADASLHHLTIQDTTLVTTKNCRLIALHSPQETTHNTSSHLMFEATLPRSLTRIKRANIRPRWKAAAAASGILDRDIIGCSADGALTGITLIDDPLWRRLSWLQRLCEWSDELSPHLVQTPRYSVSEETFARKERGLPIGFGAAAVESRSEVVMRTERRREQDRHVDGDVLARVLRKGGVACVRRLVRVAAEREDAVGEWMRAHLEGELEAVEEMVGIVEGVVDGWL